MIRWRCTLAILRKEIRNSVRDKRSFWMIVFMPSILFPLLMLIVPTLAATVGKNAKLGEIEIAVQGQFPEALQTKLNASSPVRVLKVVAVENAEQAVKKYALTVRAPKQWPRASGDAPQTLEIYLDSEKRSADVARLLLEKAVVEFNKSLWQADLKAKGVSTDVPELLRVSTQASAKPRDKFLSIMGLLLPLMFVMWGTTGSQSASLESLASERDHGTFETLLASAVTRAEVLVGKYLNVLLMACLAAASGGVGLLLMLWAAKLSLESAFGAAGAIAVGFLMQYLPQSIEPLSMLYGLVAAVSGLSVIAVLGLFPCIFAPSLKEAQLYIAPAIFLVMGLAAPAILAQTMGFGYLTKWVPLSNAIACLTASFSAPDWPQLLVAVLVNLALVALILWAAHWLINRERVIFKSA